MQAKRTRFVSQEKLTREQALWLCRAILTHYRIDGSKEDGERDYFDVLNRTHKSTGYKRGRDWVIHPVGYDLNEVIYGTEQSGIREAWASLVALPVSRSHSGVREYRTFQTYGLRNNNHLTVATYRITEVTVTSSDKNFIKYAQDCFARLVPDVQEVPEYEPKKTDAQGKRKDESLFKDVRNLKSKRKNQKKR